MRHLQIFSLAFFLLSDLTASVSSNPFLRPGSETPPVPLPKKQTSVPVKPPTAQKEIEFRGYCILNGSPLFCLFHKKSGHAEWVTVSESTYESYLVESFDAEIEKLTISHEGHFFSLTLVDSKSNAIASPPTKTIRSSPNPILTNSGKPKQSSRYMPPRPKTTPVLPSWLVNKRSSSTTQLGSIQSMSASNSSSNYSGAVPKRSFSGPLFPGSTRAGDSIPSDSGGKPQISQNESLAKRDSRSVEKTASNSRITTNPTVSETPIPEQTEVTVTSAAEESISLEYLPPPPPPPNILPPSPPPDILPTRDE